jgi:hypothetical protein
MNDLIITVQTSYSHLPYSPPQAVSSSLFTSNSNFLATS